MDSIRLDATVFWCIGTWPTNPGLPGTSCSKGSARAPGPCIYIPWLWWANIKTTERVLGGDDRETNPDLCGSCSGWSSTAGQVHRLSRWANVQILFSIELYWVVSCRNDTCLAAGCHRCTCPTKEFLNPYKTWPSKTTEKMKKEVFWFAAQRLAGINLVTGGLLLILLTMAKPELDHHHDTSKGILKM